MEITESGLVKPHAEQVGDGRTAEVTPRTHFKRYWLYLLVSL